MGYNNITWDGLFNLLNQYCASGAFYGANPALLNINVTWDQWYAEYTQNPNINNWSLAKLKNWTLHYEDFLNAGGQYFISNNMNRFLQFNAKEKGRRDLQSNPGIFNGPNPLNVPLGNNYTDFRNVPLPGVNAEPAFLSTLSNNLGYANG